MCVYVCWAHKYALQKRMNRSRCPSAPAEYFTEGCKPRPWANRAMNSDFKPVVIKKVKVAHTRLQTVGFRSWSRFLAVSMQVMWVINPVVGCHYFPPTVTRATLKRAATSFAAWWTEAQWVWTVCLRLLPDSVATKIWTPGPSAPESSTLTTRLPSHRSVVITAIARRCKYFSLKIQGCTCTPLHLPAAPKK